MLRKLNEGYQLRCHCERGTSAAIARAKAVRFAKQKSRHCEETKQSLHDRRLRGRHARSSLTMT